MAVPMVELATENNKKKNKNTNTNSLLVCGSGVLVFGSVGGYACGRVILG